MSAFTVNPHCHALVNPAYGVGCLPHVVAGAVELFNADRTRIRDAEEAIMRRRAVVSELELRTRAVTLQASQPPGTCIGLLPLDGQPCTPVHVCNPVC